MKWIITVLGCILFVVVASGQVRYLDEIFSEVEREEDIAYGQNFSVLYLPDTVIVDLLMDVYAPVGDPQPERPVVLYLHGGWFFPQIYNGDVIGSRRDSSVVEICTRLARMGYTAVAATYRKGWNPYATEVEEQEATLLSAIYHGIQDARTCVRFLRRSQAEGGNPWGIDPDRIVLWGEGSGGLISLNAGFLDRYEELLLPPFINDETVTPYIQAEIHGDPYGVEEALLNLVNHPGYSSEAQMVVGMGGAVLSADWIDEAQPGYPERPQVVGFHSVSDPYIPYGQGFGLSFVPTPIPLFHPLVGTRFAVEAANIKGYNNRLEPVLALDDPLTQYVNDLQEELFTDYLTFEEYFLATDHAYPFIPPVPRVEKAPWVWWDEEGLEEYLEEFEGIDTQNFIDNQELRYPDMSPERARAHIDTIIAFAAPRMCFSLELENCVDAITKAEERSFTAGLQVYPQPAGDQITILAGNGLYLRELQLFDAQGHLLRAFESGAVSTFLMERNGLPSGLYFIKIKTDQGEVTRKVVWK